MNAIKSLIVMAALALCAGQAVAAEAPVAKDSLVFTGTKIQAKQFERYVAKDADYRHFVETTDFKVETVNRLDHDGKLPTLVHTSGDGEELSRAEGRKAMHPIAGRVRRCHKSEDAPTKRVIRGEGEPKLHKWLGGIATATVGAVVAVVGWFKSPVA